MADGTTKRAFVLGWPVKHSRSPLIHGYWLQRHGLRGTYEKVECGPDDLTEFVRKFRNGDFVGGNVTLPHKAAVFALAEKVDETARMLGAANTLWLEGDTICVTNTDVYGFLANLDERVPHWSRPEQCQRGAVVAGAGGAARAVIYALQQRGFEQVWIANRTVEKAQRLARHFGEPCRAIGFDDLPKDAVKAAVMVNTTSVGMGDGAMPINPTMFARDTVVCDIVYSPLMTPLLERAKMSGMPYVDGLGMLLHQAVPGFEKWFGVRPDVDDTVRNIVLRDLGERA
ncbi:MAG: shikimate dehydrogenase [Ahrensia sp.]|nr:shikimate dehydrogenase [Ahrensia sp.]